MADPKSKIRWDKDNVHQVAAKLFMTKDDDRAIWEFLQSQESMAGTVKAALREYMANHAPKPKPEIDYSAFFEDDEE